MTAAVAASTETYTFDPVGNRLNSLSVPNYMYNRSNEVTAAGSSSSYTYDNNGNTLTKTDGTGTTTYTWNFENRLTSVHPPNQAIVTFKYDPFGRRIQKGGSVYVYDGANLVEEADAGGNFVARYVFGSGVDEPLAAYRGGTWEFYQADGLGSITSLSTSAGTVSDSFTYDSFGNVSSSTGSFAQPFRYTGREWDLETGLYYYRARYYDAQNGRFLSEDPVGFQAGVNFYRHVGNNPIRFRDPSGMNPLVGTLPWLGGGTLEVICWGSGTCETVVVVGGIVVGVVAVGYLAYEAYDFFRKPKRQPKPDPRGPKCEKDCAKIKLACINMCSETTLPTNDRTSQGFPFFNCVNKCMEAAGCLGK